MVFEYIRSRQGSDFYVSSLDYYVPVESVYAGEIFVTKQI